MSHRRMLSRCVSWRVSRRRLRTYGWSWGAGRFRGWTPRGWSASASMASHAACGIHPLRGRWTRPSREGSPRAHFRSSQSSVWVQRCFTVPGRGRGLGRRSGGYDGVVGTGGGGGPGGFLVVLFRGVARGVGARADVDPRVCAHGLRLGVGRGLAAAAVAGHALYVGCHRGLVGGRGRCWWTLASFWPGQGRSVGLGCGL